MVSILHNRSTPQGSTLVICCEGNAGFYEVGIVNTPLSAGYSVLGWNTPGFACSTVSISLNILNTTITSFKVKIGLILNLMLGLLKCIFVWNKSYGFQYFIAIDCLFNFRNLLTNSISIFFKASSFFYFSNNSLILGCFNLKCKISVQNLSSWIKYSSFNIFFSPLNKCTLFYY